MPSSLTNLPQPLAAILRRAGNEKSAENRHLETYHVFEAFLKLTVVTQTSLYLRIFQGKSPALNESLSRLAMAPVGHWLKCLREVSAFLEKEPSPPNLPFHGFNARLTQRTPSQAIARFLAFSAWLKAPTGEAEIKSIEDFLRQPPPPKSTNTTGSPLDVLTAMGSYRNDEMGHGGLRYAGFYDAAQSLFLAALDEALEKLDPFQGLTFARAVDRPAAGSDGVERKYVPMYPAGYPLPIEGVSAEFTALIPAGWLVWTAGSMALPIYPFLIYESSKTSTVEMFGFLNKVTERDRPGRPAAVQKVSYLDFVTGEHLDRDSCRQPLAEILALLRSAPVEVDTEAGPDLDSGIISPLSALPSSAMGRIGDFDLLEKLGAGAMGVVYKARQRSLGRLVALKLLDPGFARDPVAVSRFHREIEALAQCNDPCVIRILTSGTEGDTHYFAMEYVEGFDMSQIYASLQDHQEILAGKAVPAGAADGEPWRLLAPPAGETYHRSLAQKMAGAAHGLQHLHDHNYLHRDLKPANVMVTIEGRGVLTDLGLARRMEGDAAQTTREKDFLGTLRYLAPEQADQEKRVKPSFSTDTYGFGAVLYELSTLHPLFEGETETDLFIKVMSQAPTAPVKLVKGFPHDLETILRKALCKEPHDRYQTAAALAEDLEAFAADRPLRWARRPGGMHHLRLFYRENRLAVRMGTFFLAVLLCLGGWFVVRIKAAEETAEANADLAEKRQEAAEDMATFMLDNLRDRLRKVGKLDLLSDVAKTAITFYEGLEPEDKSPDDILNQAKAYDAFGDVLEREAPEGLGQDEEAQGKAADFNAALSLFRKALGLRAGLLTGNQEDGNVQLAVATSDGKLAGFYARRGDLNGALFLLEFDLDLRKIATGGNEDKQAELALTLDRVGKILERKQEYAPALAHYKRSQAIREELGWRHPLVPRWKQEWAESLTKEGNLFLMEGKADQVGPALQALEDAQAVFSRLAAQDPSDMGLKRDLAWSQERMANGLMAKGDFNGSLHLYREEAVIRRFLHDQEPHNIRWGRELVVALNKQGDLLMERREAGAALKLFREGLEVLRKAPEDRSNKFAEADLVRSLARVGWAEGRLGEGSRSRESFREAEAILKRLENPDVRREAEAEVERMKKD